MRYRLRTLLFAMALCPPILAGIYLDLPLTLLVVGYFGSLVVVIPAASFLAQNTAPRGRP